MIYGLGADFDGNLRRKDLTTDTPYNTYTRAGLPPSPIAMPGLASIKAALSPAETPFLYFVARGDGGQPVLWALDRHNQAVNQVPEGGDDEPGTAGPFSPSRASTARARAARSRRWSTGFATGASRWCKAGSQEDPLGESCANSCCTNRCISRPRRC